MPDTRLSAAAFRTAQVLLLLLGVRLLLTAALPGLLPLLLALALSGLLERPVRFLIRRLRLPRPAAAAAATLALVLLLAAGAGFLFRRLWLECGILAWKLPDLLSNLTSWLENLRRWVERLLVAAPLSLQEPLRQGTELLAGQGGVLVGRVAAWLTGSLARWTAALPRLGLLLFTTALATFFASADRPRLTAFLRRQLPARYQTRLDALLSALKDALRDWFRAQGLLMLATFTLLVPGLLLLRVETAVLAAGLTALLDALPVLGSGIVLLPWSLLSLFQGDGLRAVGLLTLYGLLSLLRSLLEPRLVGRSSGLPPLAALTAMYAGFSLFGGAGMVLAPLAAVLVKALHDRGVLRLWK